jgi:hypothetical protein
VTQEWLPLGVAALASLTPVPVIAAEYLSVADAQRLAFPAATSFEEVVLRLDPQRVEIVKQLAGPQPRRGAVRVFQAKAGSEVLGYLFVDEVLGREELITYALPIARNGALGTLEVLAYRESHGAEIRSPGWRRQFTGRDALDALRFRTDIKNIAGATLSCEHVTQGVRWLRALWQVAFAPTPSGA